MSKSSKLPTEINYQSLKNCTDEQLRQALTYAEKIDYQGCNQSLLQFTEASFEILDPGVQFKSNWHLGYVCEHLEMVTTGEILFLGICVPPAHMKSLSATVCWPVWTWKEYPESRWIFSSYSSDLSTTHSLKRRRLIKSDWYQSGWGNNYQLVDDQDRKTVFENDKKGYFLATSTGGTTGGKHGDFLVIDDPINPEHALSEPKRREGNAHVDYMVSTRRRDPKTSRVVLIMQRLHEDDPVKHMTEMIEKLDDTGKHKMLVIPAEAPTKTTIIMPKSKKVIERKEGDILWPERFSKQDLNLIKDRLGTFNYSAQYQQTPVPLEGGIVKQDWIKYYKEKPSNIIRSGWFWDTAIKIKEMNDWSVGLHVAEASDGYYVIEMVRKRLLYPELKSQIQISYNSGSASFVVVEDKASGQQIIQEMKKDVNFPVLPFEPKGDKMQRLSLVTPVIESGKLFLPLNAEWTSILLDELLFFPHGKFDDCVDALVMALSYFHLKKRSGTFRNTTNVPPPESGSIGNRPKW